MTAADRRDQLVRVGLDLLESRPIHELALDEVASVAGVSRTLVFHYFPSKSDYYAAVVASAGERLLSFDPGEADTTVPERLSTMIGGFLRLVSRKRGAYVALVRGASGGDPKILALLDELRSSLVSRWLEAAQWPVDDPLTRLAVRGWLGHLEEVALNFDSYGVPRESAVELLMANLLENLDRAQRMGAVQAPTQL